MEFARSCEVGGRVRVGSEMMFRAVEEHGTMPGDKWGWFLSLQVVAAEGRVREWPGEMRLGPMVRQAERLRAAQWF